ncbi:restriction endonuclease subunit S [Daejeonella sp.]|uniref:restriction endonuclease subunit S n=1 Tax=Daejeonella sp. TaxID=2805397 RepID=UPI0025B7DF2C|nr:restriction endonuclease subunit S [Daejeonella sp.]
MITETKNTKAFYNAEIPCDWEVCSLGSLADKKKKWSFTGGPFGSNLKAEDYTETGIRIIQLQNIGDGEFLDNYKIYTSDKKADELLSCNIYPGEIILSKMGDPVARGCFIPNEDKRYLMASDGIRVLPDSSRVDSFYLLSFINYSIFRTEAVKISTGSTRQRIGLDDLKSIKIPLPPLPEQKAIAQVLSTADAAIHTTEKLITQKELLKKWLMQQLLTGKKRLKGFEGEWKEHSYEKILKVVKRNFDWDENELYKLISVRRRSGGIFYREALYGHQILVKTLRTASEGDFLFSKMQILHGASALVTKEFDGAKISGSYIAVVPKEKKQLNMEFFQWYSQTPYFYHQTYISSYGVHIEKMTFDFDTFLQLEMKLPSIEEQTAISQVLQAADKEISLLKAKAEKLREQKKGLMQQLLTGKVRLKIDKVKTA